MASAHTAQDSWILVHAAGVVVKRDGACLAFAGPDDARSAGLALDEEAVALGTLGPSPAFAAGALSDGALSPPLEILKLREVYSALGEGAFERAGRAVQLVEWRRTSRFCGRCGSATAHVEGERCLRCPRCAFLSYPRIAPAVIVLVRRGEEALLARNARAPHRFYSTLAGFAEPGESLEQTLVREVREEVSLDVERLAYFGSQPWPFPHSLMVGFVAHWAGGEIRVDGVEIADAAWFRWDVLPELPPSLSIARRLIDAWVAEVQRPPGARGAR